MRRVAHKKSLREVYAQSQSAMDYYAAMSGKPKQEARVFPPKREIINHADDADLEAAVSREVAKVLALHPNVLLCIRQNSGTAWSPRAEGKDAPVWFYKIVRSRAPMRISDYWGLLVSGKPFAFECKRRNWTKPSGTREGEQQNFLMTIRNAGGIADFVTSGEQVLALIS